MGCHSSPSCRPWSPGSIARGLWVPQNVIPSALALSTADSEYPGLLSAIEESGKTLSTPLMMRFCSSTPPSLDVRVGYTTMRRPPQDRSATLFNQYVGRVSARLPSITICRPSSAEISSTDARADIHPHSGLTSIKWLLPSSTCRTT